MVLLDDFSSHRGVIGFIIAFMAAIYALRQDRLQQRLLRFQEDVGSLYRDYRRMISGLLDWFANDWGGGPYDDTQEVSGIVGRFRDELNDIENALRCIPSSGDPEEIRFQFMNLERAIKSACSIIEWGTEDGFELRAAMEPDVSDPQKGAATTLLFEGFVNGNEVIIDEYLRLREKGRDRSSFETASAWRTLLRELYSEQQEVHHRHGLDWLVRDNEPSLRVLKETGWLFVIGVGVPMLFLVSLPSFILDPVQAHARALWEPSLSTFIAFSQVGLLGFVVYKAKHVVDALRALIGT